MSNQSITFTLNDLAELSYASDLSNFRAKIKRILEGLNIPISTYKSGKTYVFPSSVSALIIALYKENAKEDDNIVSLILKEDYEKIEAIQYYNLLINANMIEKIIVKNNLTNERKNIEIINYYKKPIPKSNGGSWKYIFDNEDLFDIPFNASNINLLQSFMNFRVIGYHIMMLDQVQNSIKTTVNKIMKVSEYDTTSYDLTKVFHTIQIDNYDYLTLHNIVDSLYEKINDTLDILTKTVDTFNKITSDKEFVEKYKIEVSSDVSDIFNDILDFKIHNKGTLQRGIDFLKEERIKLRIDNEVELFKKLYIPCNEY